MLNNDAVAEPGWALALTDAIARAPVSCGMLQCLMVYQARPETINSTGIELTWFGAGHDRQEGQPRAAASAETEIFCATAGAAAYRRQMLDEIKLSTGYFDRLHFMYYEDLDLGWRARLAGYSALYVPGAVVRHKWHGSTVRRGRSWLQVLSSTNRIRVVIKNGSWRLVALAASRVIYEIANVLKHGGIRGLLSFVGALPASLLLRREVTRIARPARGEIEQRWRGVVGGGVA
jgi:GT2 family glycosyltransferase